MYHEGVRPVSVGFTVIFYRCVSKSCPIPLLKYPNVFTQLFFLHKAAAVWRKICNQQKVFFFLIAPNFDRILIVYIGMCGGNKKPPAQNFFMTPTPSEMAFDP